MSTKDTPNGLQTRKTKSEATTRSSQKSQNTKLPIRNNSIADLRVSLFDKYDNPKTANPSLCKTPKSMAKSKSVNMLHATGLTPNTKNTSYMINKSIAPTPQPRHRRLIDSSIGPETPECFSKIAIETPKRFGKTDELSCRSAGQEDSSEISKLKVTVRVRPLSAKECTTQSVTNVITVNNNELTVFSGTTADNSASVVHTFQYDNVFWSCNEYKDNYADQELVFQETALPLVDKAFEGYNACLFAYGQTGSGKSYSIMGIDEDDNGLNPESGIIPRFCQELFDRIELLKSKMHVEIEVSYFEIYNEKIHDLLAVSQNLSLYSNNPNKKPALRVREHPIWGPYVVDLSKHPVDSHEALKNWLAVGNLQRASAATGMNDKSSRSHAIFNIILNLSELDHNSKEFSQMKRSKISLVDLAGSERISHRCTTGERLREGVSINKSLLTLGKVISALVESKKSTATFVPYRESVLTWLLRENLGGNSRTVMLATISPASIHVDETLATLRYACQARSIVNRVKVNEDPHDREIRELRAEVERLQTLQQNYDRQKRYSTSTTPRRIIIETSVDESELDALRIQLNETEQELEQAQRSWHDRLREAENIRETEMSILQRSGLALKMSSSQMQPCLINLAADPMLSGTLLYVLPLGIVKIGRSQSNEFEQPDIVLDGPLVACNHCFIENRNNELFIESQNNEFETFVNGKLISTRQQIYNSDRVVIGGSHYFRVSNPYCPKISKNAIIDFQLAHQEVLKQQENRLRQELDIEKEAALLRIKEEHAANERMYSEKLASLELENFRFKCSKEMLETEKQVLEGQCSNIKFEYNPPSASKLVDEIKRILEHPSDESLHQTQLMVKEATQRCKDMGINYEFKQTQIVDEFGILKSIINICDVNNGRIAEWPTARLSVWLDIIRENDIQPNRLFDCVDIEWKVNSNEVDHMNDSLNSSQISLNLTAVKGALFEKIASKSVQQLRKFFSPNENDTIKSAIAKSSTIKQIQPLTDKPIMLDNFDEQIEILRIKMPDKKTPENVDYETQAQVYLKDLRKITFKLKKLCNQHKNTENFEMGKDSPSSSVLHCIDQIEQASNEMNRLLFNDLIVPTPRTPKCVRFLLD